MNNKPNRPKNSFTFIKIFLASISLSGLFGLWSFFGRSNQSAGTSGNLPETGLLNNALPTLVPSVLDNQPATQNLQQVAQPTPQATATPVIEKVVVNNSGRSGGGSAARTSSSR